MPLCDVQAIIADEDRSQNATIEIVTLAEPLGIKPTCPRRQSLENMVVNCGN